MNGELLVQRIKSLAISQGIKMGDLYENCGVTSGAVSQWKNGSTNPTTPALQRIADYLHVSLSELIEGTDYSAPSRSGLRIRPNPPPAGNNPSLTLRLPDNKKSPAPKEGEADISSRITEFLLSLPRKAAVKSPTGGAKARPHQSASDRPQRRFSGAV